MSLDQLLNRGSKSKNNGKVIADIELYLPPEFDITLDQWRTLFARYNRLGRITKVAVAIAQYIRDNNPGASTTNLFSVSEVVERNGRFYTDASFVKTKEGLTALYIYNSEEQVRLLPIAPMDGNGEIAHIVLSYVPE